MKQFIIFLSVTVITSFFFTNETSADDYSTCIDACAAQYSPSMNDANDAYATDVFACDDTYDAAMNAYNQKVISETNDPDDLDKIEQAYGDCANNASAHFSQVSDGIMQQWNSCNSGCPPPDPKP